MAHIHSFSPVTDPCCTKLILGSIPGKISLSTNQYYAHPRNYFWKFVNSLLEIPQDLQYMKRCEEIVRKKIALWDVLKTCTRSSSLDSDIIESSIIPNDFEAFFKIHKNINSIYFNGAKAEKIYNKHILPNLSSDFSRILTVRLPSTSPANASIPVENKLMQWSIIAK